MKRFLLLTLLAVLPFSGCLLDDMTRDNLLDPKYNGSKGACIDTFFGGCDFIEEDDCDTDNYAVFHQAEKCDDVDLKGSCVDFFDNCSIKRESECADDTFVAGGTC